MKRKSKGTVEEQFARVKARRYRCKWWNRLFALLVSKMRT